MCRGQRREGRTRSKPAPTSSCGLSKWSLSPNDAQFIQRPGPRSAVYTVGVIIADPIL